jgi:zinc protease
MTVFRATLILLAAFVLFAGCEAEVQEQGPPSAEPLERVDFPPYQTRTLENGLRVFALEHTEQPVISIQLVVAAGSSSDPESLPGLATFTSDLLLSGTTSRTAQDIAETIDFVGGTISARAAREAIIVSASALADSTGLVVELLHDVALNPAFSLEEIERLRQQTASAISADLQDPDFIADTVFNMALYGSHPYAHPNDGTTSSVQRIQRGDIVAFHEAFFAPNISTVVVAGALEPSEAFRLVEQYFGTWGEREVDTPDLSLSSTLRSRRVLVIDNPASVQTEIRIGQTMVARKDPDYFAMLVASDILGGSQGRLMESLREQRGLTYGAYEAFVPRKGPGSMYATTETRTERTSEAIELILNEIDRLRTERVSEDELEKIKAFLIGSFPLTIETPDDLATRLANVSVYDLGPEYLATYRDELAGISSADVLRVAGERISHDSVLIVLFGRADSFLDELESLGTVEVIPLSDLDLDSLSLGDSPAQ